MGYSFAVAIESTTAGAIGKLVFAVAIGRLGFAVATGRLESASVGAIGKPEVECTGTMVLGSGSVFLELNS